MHSSRPSLHCVIDRWNGILQALGDNRSRNRHSFTNALACASHSGLRPVQRAYNALQAFIHPTNCLPMCIYLQHISLVCHPCCVCVCVWGGEQPLMGLHYALHK